MKKLKSLLFFLCLPIFVLSGETIDPYKNIDFFTLDNGLKVYLLADSQAETTRIMTEVKVGTEVESKEDAGITHLVEHLLFRDQRIPYKDYLDYMKEEGTTEINARTGRYSTQYFATIDKDKSYWLVQTFAQMLFDKEVTNEDLEIEKRALQTEISEVQWYSASVYYLAEVFKAIGNVYPERKADIYKDSFSMAEDKDRIPRYFSQKNNKNFSLEAVLLHYDKYYYPENITLKVAGNFDLIKMKEVLKNSLYSQKKVNTGYTTHELPYDASLNNKPFNVLYTGTGTKSSAYIGAKYILDDYTNYLILTSYSDHLANRMQQRLRNELGKTYSVNSFDFDLRNAGIVGVNFGSLHNNFDTNLMTIKEQIKEDVRQIKAQDITEALKASSLMYTSMEHDSQSLLDRIDTLEYVHVYHKVFDKTPYEIFTQITPESFQKVVSNTFAEENTYSYILKDYYLFPYDVSVMSFLLIGFIIFLYLKAGKFYMRRRGHVYTIRDIKFSRRLSNRFFSVINFFLVFMIANLISEWSEALVSYLISGNYYSLDNMVGIQMLFYSVVSLLWFFALFLLVGRIFFKQFYIKVDVTEDYLNFIGRGFLRFSKDEICEIKKVSWSINKFSKTLGFSVFFFKPLLLLKTKSGELVYLRCKNAQELEEDLLQWKDKEIT